VAFNTVLQFPPGQRFTWVLEIDGRSDDAWRVPFATREAPSARADRIRAPAAGRGPRRR